MRAPHHRAPLPCAKKTLIIVTATTLLILLLVTMLRVACDDGSEEPDGAHQRPHHVQQRHGDRCYSLFKGL
jgi:hypothetical protein